MNGQIQCSGAQVTDQNCTFTCDPGYNLTGSAVRTCQSDHTWSGETALCPPLQCANLTAPENAFFITTCNTDYTSNCYLACEEGFYVDGHPDTIEWSQTCELVAESIVEWTNQMSCVGMF